MSLRGWLFRSMAEGQLAPDAQPSQLVGVGWAIGGIFSLLALLFAAKKLEGMGREQVLTWVEGAIAKGVEAGVAKALEQHVSEEREWREEERRRQEAAERRQRDEIARVEGRVADIEREILRGLRDIGDEVRKMQRPALRQEDLARLEVARGVVEKVERLEAKIESLGRPLGDGG